MYIKDKATKDKATVAMDPIIFETYLDITSHPTYASFQRFINSYEISDALTPWLMLINGLRLQIKLNEKANQYIEVIHNDFSKLSNSGAFEKLLDDYVADKAMHDLYIENFMYLRSRAIVLASKDIKMYERAIKNLESFLKGVIRSSNNHYHSFASTLENLLKVQESRELALWSGGIDLSDFSFQAGCCPLEETALGNFLNTNPITSLWELEAPLWNIISRTFVLNYQGRVAHVYFRLIDDTSVLMRQEVPMLIKNKIGIAWHPVINTYAQNTSSEIGTDGSQLLSFTTTNDKVEITNKLRSCGKGMALSKAINFLCAQLKQAKFKINMRVFSSANSEMFEPNHPPFALDYDLPIETIIDLLHLNPM